MSVYLVLSSLLLSPNLMPPPATAAPGREASPVLVGVLETYRTAKEGQPSRSAVRVAFKKSAGRWEPFPSSCGARLRSPLRACGEGIPSRITWTITFDGRDLGSLTSRPFDHYDYFSDVSCEEPEGGAAVPTVGKPSLEFAGFLNEPVYRPLVAVSVPNHGDPERWKAAPLTGQIVKRMQAAFRRKFPHVENCRDQSESPSAWEYTNDRIRFAKSYASATGFRLVTMSLEGFNCDDTPAGAFVPQLFVLDPSQKIRHLASQLVLVDAGDYDGDGKSEVVFMISRYNRGGYVLFYDDFHRQASFEYSYH